MTKSINSFQISKQSGDTLPIPGDVLLDLLQQTLTRGSAFYFRAKGMSMTPFINNGDFITISPLLNHQPRIGCVIAYAQSEPKRLLVHRIIALHNAFFITQGDYANNQCRDLVSPDAILGCITRVEREGRRIFLGLGPERYLIAWLSRVGLLTRIYGRLIRLKRSLSRH